MEKQTPYQKEIELIIAAIQETPWMLYQIKLLVRRAEAERKELGRVVFCPASTK